MEDLSDKRKIEYAIEKAEGGTVFVITDFTSIASYDCAKKVLQRLVEEAPSPHKVALAIVRNFG